MLNHNFIYWNLVFVFTLHFIFTMYLQRLVNIFCVSKTKSVFCIRRCDTNVQFINKQNVNTQPQKNHNEEIYWVQLSDNKTYNIYIILYVANWTHIISHI